MEGNDPLFDRLRHRFSGDANSNGTDAKPEAADDHSPATTPSDETARNVSHALNLRDVAAAGWIYWVMAANLEDKMDPEAFLVYRNLLLREAGDPRDPIERMLVEQLALAHFSLGQMRLRSFATSSPKLALGFADAATRLLGEFRRCALALEDYRAKQIERVGRSGGTAGNGHHDAHKQNGVVKHSSNGKRMPPESKVSSNGHTEVPQCLKDRMAYPAPVGWPPAAATDGSGKG